MSNLDTARLKWRYVLFRGMDYHLFKLHNGRRISHYNHITDSSDKLPQYITIYLFIVVHRWRKYPDDDNPFLDKRRSRFRRLGWNQRLSIIKAIIPSSAVEGIQSDRGNDRPSYLLSNYCSTSSLETSITHEPLELKGLKMMGVVEDTFHWISSIC